MDFLPLVLLGSVNPNCNSMKIISFQQHFRGHIVGDSKPFLFYLYGENLFYQNRKFFTDNLKIF
jgi:hypothetical protein